VFQTHQSKQRVLVQWKRQWMRSNRRRRSVFARVRYEPTSLNIRRWADDKRVEFAANGTEVPRPRVDTASWLQTSLTSPARERELFQTLSFKTLAFSLPFPGECASRWLLSIGNCHSITQPHSSSCRSWGHSYERRARGPCQCLDLHQAEAQVKSE